MKFTNSDKRTPFEQLSVDMLEEDDKRTVYCSDKP